MSDPLYWSMPCWVELEGGDAVSGYCVGFSADNTQALIEPCEGSVPYVGASRFWWNVTKITDREVA